MSEPCLKDSEIRIELARLDERLKAMSREVLRTEQASEKALGLKANELERRLDMLNHAHAEAQRVQGTTVNKELWQNDRNELEKRMRNMENFQSNLLGRMWIGGAVMLLLAVALGKLAAMWHP